MAAILTACRRRDIRSHVLIGTITTVVAMLTTSRLLQLDLDFTILLAAPIITITAYGPALAAGAMTRDANWLYQIAPSHSVAHRGGVVSAALLLAALVTIASFSIVGVVSGTTGLVAAQLPAAVLGTAAGGVLASRVSPWRSTSPSAPLVGILIAGGGTIAAQQIATRLAPIGSSYQLLAALIVVAILATASILTPETSNP